MAESLVLRLIKDVELNRRRLIENCRKHGVDIEDTAPMDDVVSANNSIDYSDEHTGQHEMRFFDVEGNKIGESIWVEDGGSFTPPDIPDFDPEHLIPNRWASAIGERFDNITHDVDYAPLYFIKDKISRIWAIFNDTTGYTIQMSVKIYQIDAITIDYGDGVQQTITASTTVSHTYSGSGEYVITLTPDYKGEFTVSKKYLVDCWDSGIFNSNASNIINSALIKAYLPIMYGSSGTNNDKSSIDYIVYENIESANSRFRTDYLNNIIIHNSVVGSNANIQKMINASNLKTYIIDPSFAPTTTTSIAIPPAYKLDKFIMPEINTVLFKSADMYATSSKLILLSGKFDSSASGGMLLGANQVEFHKPMDKFKFSFTNCYCLETVTHKGISAIETNLFPYSHIKTFKIPQGCIISYAQSFNLMHYLEDLLLYPDFDYTLNLISNYSLTNVCIIRMLNHVKDNTNGIAKTLSFASNVKLNINKFKVKLNNGIYEQCDYNDVDGMTIIEAFNSKNWTIA